MIRTLIKPESETIELKIPPEFIGKQVEVIAFTIEESSKPYLENNFTMLASEDSLAEHWLTDEEDKAWKHLQKGKS